MNQSSTQQRLVELFESTARAHSQQSSAGRSSDPDWPIWYAKHLQRPLQDQANIPFIKSRLIYCLMNADYEHAAAASGSNWSEFVASRFVECYAPATAPAEDQLALYYMPTCPYCIRVLREIKRLGLDIELRNTIESRQHRSDLIQARGRATVPVLRIHSTSGEDRWMPESLDIIDYLNRTYGDK